MTRLGSAARSTFPLVAALVVSMGVLFAVGVDPFAYYRAVLDRGLLTARGLQETITRTAPLMLLSASLIVSFGAGLINLGVDGQFILAAVAAAVVTPAINVWLGQTPALLLGIGAAGLVGALWSLLPALLRAWRGLNEAISTLLMSYLGISLANVLVKLLFRDPETTVPQTATLLVIDRLPRLFGSTIHLGVPFALIVLLATHVVMTRGAWGLRARTLGASARVARHVGIDVKGMTVAAMIVSGALAGLAGGVEIVGVWGNVRADWNPAYGFTVIPLVCLARLNGWAAAALVLMFATLTIGGESAGIRLGVPSQFVLVFAAMTLLFSLLSQRR